MSNRTVYLSRSERRIGGRLYLRFSALNGLGVSFLSDAPVTLLAIFFGAGNMEIGIISAMMHISGVILLIIPRLFRGRNVVSVGFWSWMIRGLVGLPYLALFFLDGQRAVVLIMVLYGLFCVSRTSGVAMVMTIQKRLTVSRTQSDVVFRNAMSFQGTQVISRFISYIVLALRQLAELTGLVLLPLLGIVANTMAALAFRRIPNRTRVESKKGMNLFVILRHALSLPQSRRVLMLRWISLSQMILFAMSIPFLSRSVGIDSARIFLFSIAISLAAFLSSISLRPVASRTGSRPLLFFAAMSAAVFFLMWSCIPTRFNVEVYIIAGFATMYFLNASNLAVNRLLVSITPDDGAVGFTAMETFVTSILAIILGFGAGFLANASRTLAIRTPINEYGLVFLLAAIGSLTQIVLILRTKEPGSMGLGEFTRFLTSVENLRIWQAVSNLETTADPIRRKTLIHSVGHSQAPMAPSEIKRILSEPLSQEKGALIDALFHTRRPEFHKFLISEASDSKAYHRDKAVFALGAYPGGETEETLRELLNDDDPRIRSGAAKSLGRIRSTDHLHQVQQLWLQTTELHQRLDYMIALFHMDPERRYLDDLFSGPIAFSDVRSERTLYSLVSRQFGMTPPLGILYREESYHRGGGLEMLLEESRDTHFLLEESDHVRNLWHDDGFGEIWRLCLDPLRTAKVPEELSSLVRALTAFPVEAADSANGMAILYFTYQTLTAEIES